VVSTRPSASRTNRGLCGERWPLRWCSRSEAGRASAASCAARGPATPPVCRADREDAANSPG